MSLSPVKNHNSILVLATLGVYLGLVLVGAALPAIGQSSQQATSIERDNFGIYINKRPMRDFAMNATEQIESKKIDLGAAFKVMIKGELGLAKDGKTVILKDLKTVSDPAAHSGDPVMQKLAQDAVIAISDSGWLGYFAKMGRENDHTNNVTFQLEQNEKEFRAKIIVEYRDENNVKTMASGLNGMFAVAGLQAKGDVKKFLENARSGSEGKNFFLRIELPKEMFSEFVQRKLTEQKELVK
jgi:hypothetical protein